MTKNALFHLLEINHESDLGEEEEEFEDGIEEDDDEDDDNDDLELLHSQYDNNLSTTMRYTSKTMRLNSECSDPMLLKNCRPGQKWQCINENGRWRKHKCKHNVSRMICFY